MNEPKRLLYGAGTELERELLGALEAERPSPALSRRMRQGLVAVGLLASAKTSIAGIAALVGLVSVGAGTAWVVQHDAVEARRLSKADAPAAVLRLVSSAARSAPPPTSALEPKETPPSAMPRSSVAVAPPPPATSAGDLREQIALLDRARAAVRARNSAQASAELAEYRKRFPRGEFAQEVSVLKIELLVQDGQMDSARGLGRKFIAAHPESPHVERIERLIGAAR